MDKLSRVGLQYRYFLTTTLSVQVTRYEELSLVKAVGNQSIFSFTGEVNVIITGTFFVGLLNAKIIL
jgi:hypothetical protein